MKISESEIAAVQSATEAGSGRYEGWANSSTFEAQMTLHNDQECYNAINKLASDGKLTGEALGKYVSTLGSKRFCPEGRRVEGCGIYLSEWTEGPVAWDEIAADWNATVCQESERAPTVVRVADVPGALIPHDVLGVLSESAVNERGILHLPARRLDPKLYAAVNKVLEALGGKWSRQVQGHVFTEHPRDLLDAVLQTGAYTRPSDFGFFATQPVLADGTVALARLEPGMLALEPSGGDGALALRMAKIVGLKNVKVVELLERNCAVLRGLGFEPHQGDFLDYRSDVLMDAVVMNPPFARQADIDHVMHAWNMIRPGGRLVSIMSASVRFRENTKTRLFRDLVGNYGSLIDNPDGSFKESGTAVRTVTVVLDRPRR